MTAVALPAHLKHLPPRQALLKLLQEQKRRQDQNKLARYKPYPKQQAFHVAGSTFRERLFRAGNQCITPWTFVETDLTKALSATVFFDSDVHVQSWAGESECASRLLNGFVKGIEPAFRLVTAQGHFVDCSSSHRILTEHGYLSLDQIVSLSSGLRFWGTREGLQASYVECGYLCDPQLPIPQDSALASLQLPADALQRTLSFSQEDAEERIQQCTNTFQASGHPATAVDDERLRAALFASFAGPAMHTDVLPLSDAHQALRQFALESYAALQPCGAPDQPVEVEPCPTSSPEQSSDAACTPGPCDKTLPAFVLSHDVQYPGHSTEALARDDQRLAIFFPLQSPKLVGGIEIISIVPIGFQPIIDAQVLDTHNYKAAGIFHSNCGKTWSSAYEIAYHLTGLYPDWWQGKRWNRGVTGWAIGQSMQSTRDTMQRLVLGRPGEWGTGTIPAKLIIGDPKRASGVADAVDCVFVRHVSGGFSRLYFKSCEQGREKLQGETLDFAALDEEPPEDIYMEVLTRTNATKGITWITFTPLLGMSKVVSRFLLETNPDRIDINMTIDDVGHYSEEDKVRIISQYPAHEREARIKGVPIMGSGLIFPVTEESIVCEPFQIPVSWPCIAGIDFGWDHPTAVVWLAWDRDNDVVYLYDSIRMRESVPRDIAPLIIQRGPWIPTAWPHDGLQHDKGSGIQLAEQYRQQGVNMLHEMAQLPETGDENGYKVSRTSVEAGLLEMLNRMQTGRWKVFSNQQDWLQERQLYHRKDGKIVKERDDSISASRYAMMMLRYAAVPPDPSKAMLDPFRKDYDWRVG